MDSMMFFSVLTQGVERWHCLDQGPHWWTDLVSMPQGKTIQRESKKSPSPRLSEFFHFFHKRLRIFNRFFTHLFQVSMYARLQIFV